MGSKSRRVFSRLENLSVVTFATTPPQAPPGVRKKRSIEVISKVFNASQKSTSSGCGFLLRVSARGISRRQPSVQSSFVCSVVQTELPGRNGEDFVELFAEVVTVTESALQSDFRNSISTVDQKVTACHSMAKYSG